MKPYPEDYVAALHGAAFYHPRESGLLRIEGPDRLAFLQRQSSNDLRLLQAGRALVTALTSPTARILDVFTLIEDGEALLALTLPGYAAVTARFLKSRIFFMDKVAVSDASAAFAQLEVAGPRGGEALAALGFPRPPMVDETLTILRGAGTIWAVGARSLAGPGWRLLLPADDLAGVTAALSAAGALPLGEASYQELRVEAGLPAASAELTEAFTPLEAGLAYAVAENKGCYTGQEVLARQMTYDKVTQGLAGLRLEAEAEAGAPLEAEGKPAGVLTSAALSPRFGHLALAVLKRHALPPGTQVLARCADGARVRGVTASLPFEQS
ncbi:MAG: hypothetical protein L0Z70_11075 [Chloroflexi bacterium]|nr:hypothetical protein [Chloroflexota bacterium]